MPYSVRSTWKAKVKWTPFQLSRRIQFNGKSYILSSYELNINVVPFWNFRRITRWIWGDCSEQELGFKPAIKLYICFSWSVRRTVHHHSCNISRSEHFELEICLILQIFFSYLKVCRYQQVVASGCKFPDKIVVGSPDGSVPAAGVQCSSSTMTRSNYASASTAKVLQGRAELCEQKIFFFPTT